MNRRKFLQLSTSGTLLFAGLPSITAAIGNNIDKSSIVLVSEELIASLKNSLIVESYSSRWLEIETDPILQFAEFDNSLLNESFIAGISTWMDYIILSGLFRENGFRINLLKEQKISDVRNNPLKAYHWVVG